ncbi:transcription elongation factor Elf1 [Lachnospiraceae bacterium PF1-22]
MKNSMEQFNEKRRQTPFLTLIKIWPFDQSYRCPVCNTTHAYHNDIVQEKKLLKYCTECGQKLQCTLEWAPGEEYFAVLDSERNTLYEEKRYKDAEELYNTLISAKSIVKRVSGSSNEEVVIEKGRYLCIYVENHQYNEICDLLEKQNISSVSPDEYFTESMASYVFHQSKLFKDIPETETSACIENIALHLSDLYGSAEIRKNAQKVADSVLQEKVDELNSKKDDWQGCYYPEDKK